MCQGMTSKPALNAAEGCCKWLIQIPALAADKLQTNGNKKRMG
jgi:hypothetical protein